MSYSNFYLRKFPPLIQHKINEFGGYFSLKCGDFPKQTYVLQDIEDLIVLYAELSPQYWKDEMILEYQKFFDKLLEYYAIRAQNSLDFEPFFFS